MKKAKLALVALALGLALMILMVPYVQAWNNAWTDEITATTFSDNFSDGNYNGWQVISGQWSISGGALRGQNNGMIRVDANYPFIRIITARMRTVQVGYAPYTTATLMINWKDSQNMILLRLFSTQILELIVFQNGQQVWGKQVPCAKSVYDWHTFRAAVGNDVIVVTVDSTMYFDEINSYFNNMQNSVGFHTCGDGTIADYDDVTINYHTKGSEWMALSGTWWVTDISSGFSSLGTGMILINPGQEYDYSRYVEVRMKTNYDGGGINTYDVPTIVADYVSPSSMILVRLFYNGILEWLCVSPQGNYGFQVQTVWYPTSWHTFVVQADGGGAGYARWRIWIDGMCWLDEMYMDDWSGRELPAPFGYAGLHNCNNPEMYVDYVTIQW